MTTSASHIEEAMHFRVEFLLRQAALEPELEHYWLQIAAEWMVKGCHQVRARTCESAPDPLPTFHACPDPVAVPMLHR